MQSGTDSLDTWTVERNDRGQACSGTRNDGRSTGHVDWELGLSSALSGQSYRRLCRNDTVTPRFHKITQIQDTRDGCAQLQNRDVPLTLSRCSDRDGRWAAYRWAGYRWAKVIGGAGQREECMTGAV